MAKTSAIQKNLARQQAVQSMAGRRSRLKERACDLTLSAKERMDARFLLSEMPRNGAAIRVRNRCALSGRPRGNYRKFQLSRIAFRALASEGKIPGITKASW